MKPLFFVGNRRSGTTMFTMVLNEHRNIFMSLEADALWNIYTRGDLSIPPDDAAVFDEDFVSRRVTNQESYLPYSELSGTDREKFFQDVLHIKEYGVTGRQDPYPEKKDEDLLWVGEKKPGVSSDPWVYSWLLEEFPDAKYIHMVRNPLTAIGSMAHWKWANSDPRFLIDHWVQLEQQALAIDDRLLVRMEDVQDDPLRELTRVCEYLDLPPDNVTCDFDASGRMVTKRGTIIRDYSTSRDSIGSIPMTVQLQYFMEMYGYAY